MEKHSNFEQDIIYKYDKGEVINWDLVSREGVLSNSFIKQFEGYLNFDFLIESQNFSEDFIEQNIHKINWFTLAAFQKLSEEFIRRNRDKLDLIYLYTNNNISQDVKDKFSDIFSDCETKPEPEHIDSVYYNTKQFDIKLISQHYFLSEKFIKKFSNDVDWFSVSANYNLSESFIREYKNRLSFYGLLGNKNISQDIKDKLSDIFNTISALQEIQAEEDKQVFKQLDNIILEIILEKEKTMANEEKSTKSIILDTATDRFKKGTVRSAGRKMVKGTKKGILTMMKQKGADDGSVAIVDTLLQHEMGDALIGGILGVALATIPKIKDDSRAKILSEEFQVEAVSKVEESLVDVVMEFFGPVINSVLNELPAEENEKVRVNHDEEEEEVSSSTSFAKS